MSLGQSIRNGAKWLLAGNLGNQLLQFGFGIVTARLLLPKDFGMLVTIQAFTGLAGFVAGGGMGQALIRAKEAKERDFQAIFTMQLIIGFLLYAVFFAIAPYFAQSFDNPIYRELLRISALSFLIRPFINIHRSWLSRKMRFKQLAITNTSTTLCSGIVSITFAILGFGVWSLIYGGLIGSLLTALIFSYLSPTRLRILFDINITRALGGYGIKVSANDIVSYLRSQSVNVIISKTLGPSFAGIYNKADSLAKIPFSTFSSALYDPLFRGLATIQDNRDKTRYLFLKSITILIVYTLPLYILLFWFAEPFIASVYGQKWITAAPPLKILALGGILACFGHPAGAVLAANNALGRELIVQIIYTSLAIISAIIGLHWGITSVAIGITISHIYSTGHMLYLTRRYTNANYTDYLKASTPGIALNSIMLASLFLTDLIIKQYINQNTFLYIGIETAIAGATYTTAFLLLPLESLSQEQSRFKQTIRLLIKKQTNILRSNNINNS